MANPLTINRLLAELSIRSMDNKSRNIRGTFMVAATMGWLGLIGGCATPELAKPVATTPVSAPISRPTALTEEAEAALKAAEQSVIEARAKKSLWTAAVEHLRKARAAAQIFDSAATLEHAREVAALCVLSIQQASLPPVKW